MSSSSLASGHAPNITDYEAARREFVLEVPEFFNYTADVFEKWAAQPDRVALKIGSPDGSRIDSFTFDQFRRRLNQFCRVMTRLGFQKGDRVLVLSGWRPQWYVAILAMIKLGVVPIPTTTQSRPRDVLYRIKTAGIVGVIASAELTGVVDEVAEECPQLRRKLAIAPADKTPAGWLNFDLECSPELEEFTAQPTRSDDVILIYFTSGTVAYPKMVMHTQASYGIAHRMTAMLWHDLKPTDVHWTMTDTGWAKAAWGCLFGQWTVGAQVFVSASGKFEPQKTLATIARAGITSFCAPPTVYRILVREDLAAYDLSSLRHCTSAGEPLNPEVIRIWRQATGQNIYDGYGQTETTIVLANFPCVPIKPGSMGKPVPGYDVVVVDEDGREQPSGNEGLVAIRINPRRPVGLFRGYLHDEESMAASFRGELYYTGDRAYRDSDGYFWFVSRADDVIITSGYRIGPFEVESALLEHAAVRESAVVSSPDAMRGEIVKAFVVLADGVEASRALMLELQQHVRKVTAPYKYPRAIEFVKELPKTVSGKIKRGDLRRREWAGWKGPKVKLRRRRRYGRTYRRLGLLGMLEQMRRRLVRK